MEAVDETGAHHHPHREPAELVHPHLRLLGGRLPHREVGVFLRHDLLVVPILLHLLHLPHPLDAVGEEDRIAVEGDLFLLHLAEESTLMRSTELSSSFSTSSRTAGIHSGGNSAMRQNAASALRESPHRRSLRGAEAMAERGTARVGGAAPFPDRAAAAPEALGGFAGLARRSGAAGA